MKHGNMLNRYTGTNPNIHLIHILKLGISTATVLSQVRLQGKYAHLCYNLHDSHCHGACAPAVCAMKAKQMILSPKRPKLLNPVTYLKIGFTF